MGQPWILSPVVWLIYIAKTLWMLVECLGRVVKCSNRLLVRHIMDIVGVDHSDMTLGIVVLFVTLYFIHLLNVRFF